MNTTLCRHAALSDMLPEALPADIEILDGLLLEAYPGLHPNDLPLDTFQWLRDGTGAPPPVSVIVDVYNGLSESRKLDLYEAAKVIKNHAG